MSNDSKRGKGVVEEIAGKVKQTVGAIVGNEKMEAEGHVEKVKGEARQEAAKVAERVKDKVGEIKSDARHKANS